MLRHGPPAEPGRCPARETLADFSRGRLAEPVLESIAGHLAGCRPCLDALSEIQQRAAGDLDARLRRMLEVTGFDPTGPGGETGGGSRPAGPDGCAGMTLGRYAIVEEIGAGGMGVVYRAEQIPVKQVVALKTIRNLLGAGPDRLARFRTEGAALARLRHPNVVRLYHFDDHDGRPYFTMELVEGGSLADRLKGGPLDFPAAAELVRALAGAVAYAHARQVIHRDLKPANVLLTADGTPKVSDFGLAKILDGENGKLTDTDAVMGTPSYMAPEQAAGRTAEIGPRTDVYALGAILYESLGGVPPFAAGSKPATLARVQAGDVVPPSRHRKGVPADLEAVCLKCLATSPDDRFPTADVLAEELGRWLAGKRTRTRRPGRWRRVVRTARRHARAYLGGASLVAGLVGAAAVLLPRPGGTAAPDGESEAVRRELEAELDAGRPVTLVGEAGWPKWFRWQAGKDVQRTHIEPDGVFSAEMLDRNAMGLLELLPDPRTERYKLTAQIRHDQGKYGGFVGLYAAHRTYPRQPRDVQFFIVSRFNSVTPAPRVIVLPQTKEKIQEGHTQQMSVGLHVRTDRTDPPNIGYEWNEILGPRLAALGPRNGVWHDLEVDVMPDRVTTVVDGNRMELPATALRGESLQAGVGALRRRHAEDPGVRNLRLEYAPRGGLGLALYPLSAASVRGVTITPLSVGQ